MFLTLVIFWKSENNERECINVASKYYIENLGACAFNEYGDENGDIHPIGIVFAGKKIPITACVTILFYFLFKYFQVYNSLYIFLVLNKTPSQ